MVPLEWFTYVRVCFHLSEESNYALITDLMKKLVYFFLTIFPLRHTRVLILLDRRARLQRHLRACTNQLRMF